MARRKKSASGAKAGEAANAAAVPVIPAAPEAPVGIGVNVSRSRSKSLRLDARRAGSKSDKFPKGGGAFARWCESKGIHTLDTRPVEEWEELLEEFASRSVHGLRRGPDGQDHRPNARDLRR